MEALFNGRFKLVVMVALLPWEPVKRHYTMKLTVLRPYLSYYKGEKDKGYTKMLHTVCSTEWKIEIGCHGCSVAMVTSQRSTSI